MKVLYLNHRAGLGGGEISFVQFLEAFTQRHEVHPVCILGEEGPLWNTLNRYGVRRTLVAMPRLTLSAALGEPAAVGKLRAVIAKLEPDLIHAQTPRAAGYAVRARNPGAKVIWHLRTCGKWGLKEKHVAAKVDRIIAISQAVAASVTNKYAAKVTVIENGVAAPRPVTPDEAAAWRVKYGIPPELPLVGYVGRLDHHKGLEFLLEVAAALQARLAAGWLFVGVGPLLEPLTAQAARLGLKNIFFPGFLDTPAPVWRACAATITATESEGFGRSVVESILAGCPAFHFPVGGLAELGLPAPLVLTERTPAAVARVLENTLLNSPAMIKLVEEHRRRFAERFGLERHVAAIHALYHDLLTPGGDDSGI